MNPNQIYAKDASLSKVYLSQKGIEIEVRVKTLKGTVIAGRVSLPEERIELPDDYILTEIKDKGKEVEKGEISSNKVYNADCVGNGKKYQIIYADPPWRYNFSKKTVDSIEAHYPTMSLEEIKNLNIPAEDNSVLYLWATAPKILEALGVMESWGFTYKTQAIWDKGGLGLGYWFRGQHEILLVGTKGKFSPPFNKLRVGSVFRIDKGKHSKKPNKIRELIDLWYPECSKLELFAREKVEGWSVWGNEVESDIKLKENK